MRAIGVNSYTTVTTMDSITSGSDDSLEHRISTSNCPIYEEGLDLIDLLEEVELQKIKELELLKSKFGKVAVEMALKERSKFNALGAGKSSANIQQASGTLTSRILPPSSNVSTKIPALKESIWNPVQGESSSSWSSLIKTKPPSAGSELMEFIEPIYEDGNLLIDEEIEKQGVSEWEDRIVGLFLDRKISFSIVKDTVKEKWKLKGDFDMSLDGDLYYFKLYNQEDRDFILNEGSFFIKGKPFIVRPWSIEVEENRGSVSSIPVWIKLHNVPKQLWNAKGLSAIASGVGKPKCMDKSTEGKQMLSFARVSVEIYANKEIPERLKIKTKSGKVFIIPIELPWKPHVCTKCCVFGHNTTSCEKRNFVPPKNQKNPAKKVGASENAIEEVAVVGSNINVNANSNGAKWRRVESQQGTQRRAEDLRANGRSQGPNVQMQRRQDTWQVVPPRMNDGANKFGGQQRNGNDQPGTGTTNKNRFSTLMDGNNNENGGIVSTAIGVNTTSKGSLNTSCDDGTKVDTAGAQDNFNANLTSGGTTSNKKTNVENIAGPSYDLAQLFNNEEKSDDESDYVNEEVDKEIGLVMSRRKKEKEKDMAKESGTVLRRSGRSLTPSRKLDDFVLKK